MKNQLLKAVLRQRMYSCTPQVSLLATRGGKKKKGGGGEAGPLTNDIVNIFKDRKDPIIRETEAYPKYLLEMTKETYTYDDVMFQLYRGERMPDEKEQWTLAQNFRRTLMNDNNYLRQNDDVYASDDDIGEDLGGNAI